jgi:NADP-dependent 3-hydroxy acid dehydrogenase YdfG
MTTTLQGTAVLITGASSGIGEATALLFAQHGASVAIAARRKDRLDELAKKIEGAGGKAQAIEADVTRKDHAQKAVDETVAAFGRLDTLVNNAGVMLLGPIVGADPAEWDRMISLNVQGLMYCTNAALPHLLTAAESEPRRVADIVNISSVAGRVARSGSGVYNASKFAVGAFSESLRYEITKRHVRVSLVEPGAVVTELSSHNRPEIREMIAQRFQSFERLQSEDIADAIAYIVTRARHIAINEILVRPTEQDL